VLPDEQDDVVTEDAFLATRSADDYADFLTPHLRPDCHLLDVGCGNGALSLGLAAHAGRVTAIDLDIDDLEVARAHAVRLGISNAKFREESVYALNLPDNHVDAVFAHSVLEALERPADALDEMVRVLKHGGLLAVASVEYGGFIVAGPKADLLRRFYEIREELWLLEGADPYLGRHLRGLLATAGLADIVASAKYFSFGTRDTVRDYALDRADECSDEWFAPSAVEHGLATADDLRGMARAWTDWSEAPEAYAAFAWCRAVGRKP
jgi:2-polyprenyl-3-methyl-5-hydroxy-6-metoxy-1,4-benzoquinol methylase